MKRTLIVTALLAMGLLVASPFAAAQQAPAVATGGQVTLGLLGAPTVESSKFQEYREIPKGLSIPFLNLFSTSSTFDFNLRADHVWQKDQRYTGWANLAWVGVSFDYNQISHNMGNNGHTLMAETAPGVWSMSSTLRKTLGDAVDAVSSAARTFPFYDSLLAPTIASAGSVDLQALRQRGEVEFDLGKKLPFDLAVTYMREVKTGNRGESSGTAYGVVQTVVAVPDALNEVTQDFLIRWGYKFKADKVAGNVHATFNRNLYNDRQDWLVIDNPFRATDLAYTSASVPGGPAQARFGTAPDNQASRGAFGLQLKLARQTRIAGDFAFNAWTQNAQYLPYTINSAVVTGTGAPANLTSSLLAQSMNGKINTTTLNFSFSSRPIEGLGIRMRYRSYDLSNKTTPTVWTGNVGAGDVERKWSSTTTSTDEPYGFATANPYSNTTKRFDAQVSYDIEALTLEAAVRTAKLTRTHREATSGDQNGAAFSAVYHASDWLGLRAVYDWDHRTAKGETVYGFQSDEAERKTKRAGVDLELTPSSKVGFVFAYFRRHDDYPGRPDRIALSGGVPVAGAVPFPGTPSGLLSAKYDEYTGEVDLNPSERVELSAYYTYEKNATTNQWSTTTGTSLNNLLNYAGRDKTGTFGLNAVFHLVPEKWTFSLMGTHQKVDGLMDVTAREAGSFYTPGRTTLVPAGTGGARDFTDFDDTELTTVLGQLDYALAKAWTLSAGYWYEKYSFADAFTSGTTIFPQAVLFFLKGNDGAYKANVVFSQLKYRF